MVPNKFQCQNIQKEEEEKKTMKKISILRDVETESATGCFSLFALLPQIWNPSLCEFKCTHVHK